MQHGEVIWQVIRHKHCSFMAKPHLWDPTGEKIMTTPRKETTRRQEKVEKAALLDKSIEKELLERLSKGVYADIYNYPKEKYEEILDREALQVASEEEDEELEVEYVEGYEDLEEEDDMEDFDGLGIRDSGLDDDTGMDDDDDNDEEEAIAIHWKSGRKDSVLARRRAEKDDPSAKSKKKARVLVEVEHEDTSERWTSLQQYNERWKIVGMLAFKWP